jgi:two-component system NarL family sensor kinase
MENSADIAVAVIVATGLLLLLIGFVGLLLVVNANRRHRHRAELAELHLERDRALREAEREAIQHTLTEVGRELHDNVGQLLTVAQVGLHDHLDEVAKSHPRVDTALEALDEGVEEVRRLGRSLDQDRWGQRGLLDALEAEAVRLERLGKARVLFNIAERPADPDPDVKTMLFRSFQEVVSNALRHSGASTLTITVHGHPAFGLCVKDDGCGFQQQADGNGNGNGNGLANIQRRCALVGYGARLESTPGQGTTWTFIPRTP